ncbi:MAG: WD40 repeat domain-containing protein [Promethearchaeota archaeon]
MDLINSEKTEETILKKEDEYLTELKALRKEVNALRDEIKKEKGVTQERRQKPIIRKVLKCYRAFSKDRDQNKDLDVRRMVITPDDKYLITCSEIQLGETPRVCVWSLDKILQKIEKEEDILKGTLKAEDVSEREEGKNGFKKDMGNWLLCIDALTAKVNEKEIWIVCTGSIEGDIYIWAGDIDEKTKEWKIDHSFCHRFSERTQIQKAIFDIKILQNKVEDSQDENIIKDGFKIYYSSNTIGVYSKDKTERNFIKELLLIPQGKEAINFRVDSGIIFSEEEEWILTFEIFDNDNKSFLVTGSNDNNIYKWNLKTGERESLVGKHENGITCVKISNDGKKVASGCLDNDIKVWDLDDGRCILEKYEHTKQIVSIAFQEDDKYLITASKDNIIKVWNIADKVMVRNIDLNTEIEDYNKIKQHKNNLKQQGDQNQNTKPELKMKKYGPGLDYLRQILLSPKDQYIFAIKKNKILVLRNYGRIWHFSQQLKHLEENYPQLYKKIYGPNLNQIARNLKENEKSFKEIYSEITRRLEESNNTYNLQILGPIFIPSFVKYEDNEDNQKIYIDSVRANYESYWYSATKMIHEIPDLQWTFKLFLTTDIENPIKKANYIEVTNFFETNSKKKDRPFIILNDRTQSQVRFLMVLDNVPTTFIPLLKSVILDIEDDRGDKDKLIFTDFKLSRRRIGKQLEEKKKKKKVKKETDDFPLNILKKPYKSLKDAGPYKEVYKSDDTFPDRFYYSHCIFKLDERYSVKASATVKVRKITVELTESLNPFESKKKVEGDIDLFEAFRNNFHSPPTPSVNIKIGKGFISAGGKILDKYLAGLVTLDFLFTIISVLILYRDVFINEYLKDPVGTSLFILNICVSALFIVVLIWILVNPFKDFMTRRRLGRPGIVTN